MVGHQDQTSTGRLRVCSLSKVAVDLLIPVLEEIGSRRLPRALTWCGQPCGDAGKTGHVCAQRDENKKGMLLLSPYFRTQGCRVTTSSRSNSHWPRLSRPAAR